MVRAVSREAEKFAALLRAVPVEKDWPNHPAIRPMLRGFRNINKALAKRDRSGGVSLLAQRRIGREFGNIGTALAAGAKARARGARRARSR